MKIDPQECKRVTPIQSFLPTKFYIAVVILTKPNRFGFGKVDFQKAQLVESFDDVHGPT